MLFVLYENFAEYNSDKQIEFNFFLSSVEFARASEMIMYNENMKHNVPYQELR